MFPEYHTAFSDVFGETSKELLSHFQTADNFENITSEQLENALAKVSFKGFAKNKITQISELAASSVRIASLYSFGF